jgi:hypothetical protein
MATRPSISVAQALIHSSGRSQLWRSLILGLTASKGLTASWRPKALLLTLRVRQGIAKLNFILGWKLVELRVSFVEERGAPSRNVPKLSARQAKEGQFRALAP